MRNRDKPDQPPLKFSEILNYLKKNKFWEFFNLHLKHSENKIKSDTEAFAACLVPKPRRLHIKN